MTQTINIPNPIEGLAPLTITAAEPVRSWQDLMDVIYEQILASVEKEQGPAKGFVETLQRRTAARDQAREIALASGLPSMHDRDEDPTN